MKKDISKLLARLKYYGRVFFSVLIGFGAFLVLSILCTYAHMYTVNTKRKGKKGCLALTFVLFCPCCKDKKKVNRLKSYDDESEEEEEDSYYQE